MRVVLVCGDAPCGCGDAVGVCGVGAGDARGTGGMVALLIGIVGESPL